MAAWPLHVYVRVSASYQVKSPRAFGLMSEKSRCGEVPRVVRTARRRTGLADDDEAGSDCSSRRTTSSFTLCARVAKEKTVIVANSGLARGDREHSLNDAQRPQRVCVRLALGTGYNRLEGWSEQSRLCVKRDTRVKAR